ncbi:hypothetical protein Ndes2437B_g02243 [Nannochloris sp. 'desiccata']
MSNYAAEEGRLIYVSNLPDDVRERDIDNIFGKYGRIRAVNIKKLARPPPFAFVEFSDRRDASDAVRGRDNYDFYGYRLRVEFAKGRRNDRGNDRDRGDRGGDRYARDDRRDDKRGGRDDRDRRDDRRGGDRKERTRREFRPRNTAFRVLVKGLPSGASWQDLKDFIKKAVRPIYTDVEKDGEENAIGVVGFENLEDVERCISKLDDTKFESKDADKDCYVRVLEDKEHRSGGGDGAGRRKSRSRSRSPANNRRDSSPSPRRVASPSRSRSRSPVAAAPRQRAPSRSAGTPPRQQQEAQEGSPAPCDASRSPSRSRSLSQDVDVPV